MSHRSTLPAAILLVLFWAASADASLLRRETVVRGSPAASDTWCFCIDFACSTGAVLVRVDNEDLDFYEYDLVIEAQPPGSCVAGDCVSMWSCFPDSGGPFPAGTTTYRTFRDLPQGDYRVTLRVYMPYSGPCFGVTFTVYQFDCP